MICKDDIILKQVSAACPQEFEAHYKEKEIGHLYLRHRNFSVTFSLTGMDGTWKQVLSVRPAKSDGIFEPEESDMYLTMAKEALVQAFNSESENDKAQTIRDEQNNCDHEEPYNLWVEGDPFYAEDGHWKVETRPSFIDLDLHRYQCTQCGLVKYYSEYGRKQYEN